MMSFLIGLISILAALLAAAAFIMFAEILVSTSTDGPPRLLAGDRQRPAVLVLVPAHNEGSAMLPTLADISSQLRPNDRLLVVADNCSDDTAICAQAAGAEVVVRTDPDRRGKGYALDFGLRSLQQGDPDIVIVIDADCRLEEGALEQLALTCARTNRPVQALYLMRAPQPTVINHQIAEFAWRVKNDLRPRGLQTMGLPCQLMGTGMAFPREALASIDLATGHLAEDLDLGLQMAIAGFAPLFCSVAVVSSEFPATADASARQRQRWEHGHLAVLATRVLPSVWGALRRANGGLLALSLDAAVPPLVLLGLLLAATLAGSALIWFLGQGSLPLLISSFGMVFFAVGLVLAWLKCGRDLLTLRTITVAIPYLAAKYAIYARIFAPNKKWERTSRRKPD